MRIRTVITITLTKAGYQSTIITIFPHSPTYSARHHEDQRFRLRCLCRHGFCFSEFTIPATVSSFAWLTDIKAIPRTSNTPKVVSAPIDGYEIAPMKWTGQVDRRSENITLEGTLEEITVKAREINPDFGASSSVEKRGVSFLNIDYLHQYLILWCFSSER